MRSYTYLNGRRLRAIPVVLGLYALVRLGDWKRATTAFVTTAHATAETTSSVTARIVLSASGSATDLGIWGGAWSGCGGTSKWARRPQRALLLVHSRCRASARLTDRRSRAPSCISQSVRATHGYLDTLRILGLSVFRIRILATTSIRIRILSADTCTPPRPVCASHFWVAYLPFLGYRRMHVYNINEPS